MDEFLQISRVISLGTDAVAITNATTTHTGATAAATITAAATTTTTTTTTGLVQIRID